MKTVLTTLLVSAVIALIGGIGFAYSGLYDVSAAEPHNQLSNWLMKTTMHASVERRAKDIVVPELTNDMKRAGANDFEAMCVSCHGAPGKPLSAMGQGLNPKAGDLAKSAEHLSAQELYWITKRGIKMTGMPAWGASHGDEALWPVVAFITQLPNLGETKYEAYLAAAKGSGHHSQEAHEPDPNEALTEKKPEHEHSSHDH